MCSARAVVETDVRGTLPVIGDTQNRPGIGLLLANQGSPQQEAPLP